ncbi:ABC transporter ATP-binding protein [Ravibacter arvi]|uniref:ABC transporter ATP-binding protein n=1 Tax=Ravibacter arvi TaxID=2051041 RepID=A0ABP8LWP5_9BACT
MPQILEVAQVSKSYPSFRQELTVLENIDLNIERGATLAIVGPSGSGKTTLLGLCAGLDRATSGTVTLDGKVLNHQTEDQLARIRNENVGFIFQNFQLLPTLTALENVMVPLELAGKANPAATATELLEKVGLSQRLHHYPTQLSGGEQQRVSLARAFANRPKILFADEPTGNLDAETSEKVISLLFELNKEAGTTLVLVTHDMDLASRTERIIRIKGGKIISDTE